MGRDPVSMLSSPFFGVLAGSLLGFLSGLGTGGGSLLILWLTVVLEMDPGTARIINLMFFIPSALIACLFRWKQGKLALSGLLPAALCGCAAAAISAWIGTKIDVQTIRKLFGLLLLITGVRELLYRPRKAR